MHHSRNRINRERRVSAGRYLLKMAVLAILPGLAAAAPFNYTDRVVESVTIMGAPTDTTGEVRVKTTSDTGSLAFVLSDAVSGRLLSTAIVLLNTQRSSTLTGEGLCSGGCGATSCTYTLEGIAL